MTAVITIQRAYKAWVGRAAVFPVEINGRRVGRLGNGDTIELPVNAGTNHVRVKMFGGQAMIELDVGTGERVELYCDVTTSFTQPLRLFRVTSDAVVAQPVPAPASFSVVRLTETHSSEEPPASSTALWRIRRWAPA